MTCKFLIVFLLLSFIQAALVQTGICEDVHTALNLDKMLMDVAIDKENRKLKFFLNSKVIASNLSDTNPIITDVDPTTNLYTTFHATVWFRGSIIANENKRFCDMVGVKNTTEYLHSARFPTHTVNNTVIINPVALLQEGLLNQRDNNPNHKRDLEGITYMHFNRSLENFDPHYKDSFANSNKTIHDLYSNSTGQFIGCPLYDGDSIYIYYEVDISKQIGKLGSFMARFAIVNNNGSNSLIGCNTTYVTESLNKLLINGLLYGISSLIFVTGIINFLTIVFSTYQESANPFLFVASTICNENLLKQLEATVQRIILYLQFALFTAGLNIGFPGFYRPILSSTKWIALLGFNIIRGNRFYGSTQQDNIYLTYHANGLSSLSYFANFNSLGKNWWNFILTLVIWIFIQVLAQSLIVALNSVRKYGFSFNFGRVNLIAKRSFCFILGVVLHNFLISFAYPFLITTLFLFYLTGESRAEYFPNIQQLRRDSFMRNVSYDNLFAPLTYIHFQNLGRNFSGEASVDRIALTKLNNAHIPFGLITMNLTLSNSTNVTDFSYTFVHRPQNAKRLAPTLVVASLFFALWMYLTGHFIFNYLYTFSSKLRLKANKNVTKLYTSVNTLLVWSFYYHHLLPSKNDFVIIETVLLVLRLMVISLLQASGVAQVICMIIIEFLNVLLVFMIKPYYLRLTWTTTRWMIPFAKLLVTVLCIPFLPALNCSESSRTYVAYTQFCIHFFIAAVFLCQLFYCFSSTMISAAKLHHKQVNVKCTNELTRTDSLEEFNQQFEYKPVNTRTTFILPPANTDDACDVDEFGADFYYRSNAEIQLRKHSQEKTILDNTSIVSNKSFKRQQEFSFKRQLQNDYTKREGDMIYRKYFDDDEIDPEIKELWDSRHNWKSNGEKNFDPSQTLKSRFRQCLKKPEPQVGFVVSRPKQLVVRIPKPDLTSEASESSDIYKNLTSLMYNDDISMSET